VAGWVLADRNYGSPRLAEQVGAQGGSLLAPLKGGEALTAAAAALAHGKRRGSRRSSVS
jgi:hypothetical protein